MNQANSYDVAIIGMAGQFPGAETAEMLWENLAKGIESITRLSIEDLKTKGLEKGVFENPSYVPAVPMLKDIEMFDAAFFGLSPKEVDIMDPQQRLFLENSWKALEHAGYDPLGLTSPVGVFAGARTNTYLLSLSKDPNLLPSVGMFHIGLANDLAFLTARIAHAFNLRGPSVSIHSACSTSLVAVHLACQSLLIGECDMALAGGVAVNIPHAVGYQFEEGGVQSPDGHCRTFDAAAGGTVFGSGVGVVVLKRLEDAVRDADSIYAVIRGSAVNNDGSKKASFTAPSVDGQARVILEALAAAGVEPEAISYVECHGTATLLGDAIEARALTRAFGAGRPRSCAVGSVKTNLGHLDAAAGITGLIKVVQSMRHRLLPPSLHFKELNPQIDFSGSPFYVNTALSEWRRRGEPLRAGVSAFGVGGTNAHVVVEEAPEPVPTEVGREWQLLVLSARTESALAQTRVNLAEHLRQCDQDLADVAFTLQTGRHRFSWRDSVVCRDREGAVEALSRTSSPQGEMESGSEVDVRTVAFLFPGQGSQYAAMGGELYQNERVFREHFDDCATRLQTELNLDLRKVLFSEGSVASIEQTALAQPALFAVEYSIAQLWMSFGVVPKAMLGHSLGEYTAACLAGVMSLEDALKLVALRGRLMQQMPAGGMVSVSLSAEDVQQFLTEGVTVAAINAPDLCVVAGGTKGIAELENRLGVEGIACQRLRTSHAFHCSLVESSIGPFLEELGRITLRAPQIPFISNLTGGWIRDDEARDPNYWAQQMRSPVRFRAAMGTLLQDQGRILLEAGPGQTLRRLALRQPEISRRRLVLASLPSGPQGSEQHSLLSALGRLWEAGLAIHWAAFHPERRRRVPLPPYPFERKRHWIDPPPPDATTTPSPNLSQLHSTPKYTDIRDWFWAPSFKLSNRRLPRAVALSEARTWLLFVDEWSLAADLTEALALQGADVIRVQKGKRFARLTSNTYLVDPFRRDDYEQLLNSILHTKRQPTDIVHLWNGDVPGGTVSGSQAGQEESLQVAQMNGVPYLLQALAATRGVGQRRLWVIANHSVMVESTDVIVPEKSAIMALCRVAAQESQDSLFCSFIDLGNTPPPQQQPRLIQHLLDELREMSDERVVAYRACLRWVQRFDRVLLQPPGPSLSESHEQKTFVITGGLGAVGLLLARHLASSRARVVLIGRASLPPQERWAEYLNGVQEGPNRSLIVQLLGMVKDGLDISVLQADVTSSQQMRTAIDLCFDRFGTVDGIIHAAGVTTGPTLFREISELTTHAFARQMQPKLGGLRAIGDAIEGRNVPFVLAFSSNASILGGLGFAAYAAANYAMESYVAAMKARQSVTVWMSASWDHWPAETKQLTQYHTTLDKYAMTKQEAFDAVDRIIEDQQPGQMIVATGDLIERLSTWVNTPSIRAKQDHVTRSSTNPRPSVRTRYVAPANATEQQIATIWEEFLGIDGVGVNDDFFDLGGHSLLATRIISRIRLNFGVDVPLVRLFEGPTVAQIAQVLASYLDAAEVLPDVDSSAEPTLNLLREVDSDIDLLETVAKKCASDQAG